VEHLLERCYMQRMFTGESKMNEWVDVQDALPHDGQRITVIGVPFGMEHPVELDIRYHAKVGLIHNITHWKPREEKH